MPAACPAARHREYTEGVWYSAASALRKSPLGKAVTGPALGQHGLAQDTPKAKRSKRLVCGLCTAVNLPVDQSATLCANGWGRSLHAVRRGIYAVGG